MQPTQTRTLPTGGQERREGGREREGERAGCGGEGSSLREGSLLQLGQEVLQLLLARCPASPTRCSVRAISMSTPAGPEASDRSCVLGTKGHTSLYYGVQVQKDSRPLGLSLPCQGNVLPLGKGMTVLESAAACSPCFVNFSELPVQEELKDVGSRLPAR